MKVELRHKKLQPQRWNEQSGTSHTAQDLSPNFLVNAFFLQTRQLLGDKSNLRSKRCSKFQVHERTINKKNINIGHEAYINQFHIRNRKSKTTSVWKKINLWYLVNLMLLWFSISIPKCSPETFLWNVNLWPIWSISVDLHSLCLDPRRCCRHPVVGLDRSLGKVIHPLFATLVTPFLPNFWLLSKPNYCEKLSWVIVII